MSFDVQFWLALITKLCSSLIRFVRETFGDARRPPRPGGMRRNRGKGKATLSKSTMDLDHGPQG